MLYCNIVVTAHRHGLWFLKMNARTLDSLSQMMENFGKWYLLLVSINNRVDHKTFCCTSFLNFSSNVFDNDDSLQNLHNNVTYHCMAHCRMSCEDFSKNFSKLEICNLGPSSVTDASKKRFQETVHEGCWKKRVNAGGCTNYMGQCRQRQQY